METRREPKELEKISVNLFFIEQVLYACFTKFSGRETDGLSRQAILGWLAQHWNVRITSGPAGLMSTEKFFFHPSVLGSTHLYNPDLPESSIDPTISEFCRRMEEKRSALLPSSALTLKQACGRLIQVLSGSIYQNPECLAKTDGAKLYRLGLLDKLKEFIFILMDDPTFASIQEKRDGDFYQMLQTCLDQIDGTQYEIKETQIKSPNDKAEEIREWMRIYGIYAAETLEGLTAYIHQITSVHKFPHSLSQHLNKIFELYVNASREVEDKPSLTKPLLKKLKQAIIQIQNKLARQGVVASKSNLSALVQRGVLSLEEAGLLQDYVLEETRVGHDIVNWPEERPWVLSPKQLLREVFYHPESMKVYETSVPVVHNFYSRDGRGLSVIDEYGLAFFKQAVVSSAGSSISELEPRKLLPLFKEVTAPGLIDFSTLPHKAEDKEIPVSHLWPLGIFHKMSSTRISHGATKSREGFFAIVCGLLTAQKELSDFLMFLKAVERNAKIFLRADSFVQSYEEFLKRFAKRTLESSLKLIATAMKEEREGRYVSTRLLEGVSDDQMTRTWKHARLMTDFGRRESSRHWRNHIEKLAVCCMTFTDSDEDLAKWAVKQWKMMPVRHLSVEGLLKQKPATGPGSHLSDICTLHEHLIRISEERAKTIESSNAIKREISPLLLDAKREDGSGGRPGRLPLVNLMRVITRHEKEGRSPAMPDDSKQSALLAPQSRFLGVPGQSSTSSSTSSAASASSTSSSSSVSSASSTSSSSSTSALR